MRNLMDELDASRLGLNTTQPMRLPGIESYKTQKAVSKTLFNAGPGSLVRLAVSGLSWACFGEDATRLPTPSSAARECATASAMILHSQARYRKMLVLLLGRQLFFQPWS
jgi:hypothetical protein